MRTERELQSFGKKLGEPEELEEEKLESRIVGLQVRPI